MEEYAASKTACLDTRGVSEPRQTAAVTAAIDNFPPANLGGNGRLRQRTRTASARPPHSLLAELQAGVDQVAYVLALASEKRVLYFRPDRPHIFPAVLRCLIPGRPVEPINGSVIGGESDGSVLRPVGHRATKRPRGDGQRPRASVVRPTNPARVSRRGAACTARACACAKRDNRKRGNRRLQSRSSHEWRSSGISPLRSSRMVIYVTGRATTAPALRWIQVSNWTRPGPHRDHTAAQSSGEYDFGDISASRSRLPRLAGKTSSRAA